MIFLIKIITQVTYTNLKAPTRQCFKLSLYFEITVVYVLVDDLLNYAMNQHSKHIYVLSFIRSNEFNHNEFFK